MKQEIIEQMRAELYDTCFCRSDFEKYDVEELKEDEEYLLACEVNEILGYQYYKTED